MIAEKRDRHRDISGVHHMPARSYTYRLTLTPATEAALLRLKECGENKQLLSRGHESLKTYLYYTIAWIGYLPLTPWAA